MKTGVVIDTNVLVVANRRSPQADPACENSCMEALQRIKINHRIFVDAGGDIFDEYSKNLSRKGQPGVGDAFFKWLWDFQGNPERCRQISLTPCDQRGYKEFPADPNLSGFDPSDRKFVAVALASKENPEVYNAVDSDWWERRTELNRNGVDIKFLCPQAMKKEIRNGDH